MLFKSATFEREHRKLEDDLVHERSKLLNAKDTTICYNKQDVSSTIES